MKIVIPESFYGDGGAGAQKTLIEGGKLYLLDADGNKIDAGTILPVGNFDLSQLDLYQTKTDSNLITTSKEVVGAINELKNILKTNPFDSIGDLTSLNTDEKTNLVRAINDVNLKIGALDTLTTSETGSIVGAINSLKTLVDDVDLSDYQKASDNTLTTTDKTIVGAIKELKKDLDDIDLSVFGVDIQIDSDGQVQLLDKEGDVLGTGFKLNVKDWDATVTKVGNPKDGSKPSTGLYADIDKANQDIKDIKDEIGTKKTSTDEATGIYKYIDDNAGNVDLTDYQKVNDDTLTTTSKEVNSAINELDAEIGDLNSLATTAHDNLVDAMNELFDEKVNSSDIVDNLTSIDINKPLSANQGKVLKDEIGDLNDLTTTSQDNLVNVVNELDSDIGDKTTLTTTNQSDLVSAINELDEEIGDLTQLKTTTQTSLTESLNEVVDDIGEKREFTPKHYVLDNASGTFTVVGDDKDPFDELTEVKITDANKNNDGTPFVEGDKVNLVDEVTTKPATGMYLYVDNMVAQAQLGGSEVDLSGYQEKSDNTLTTTDKTIVGGIIEIDGEVKALKVKVGKEGIPQHYALSDDGTGLIVVADGTLSDPSTEIEEKDVLGIATIGEYVKLVSKVDSTGLYKYVDDKVGDIDFSTLQPKEDDSLNTTSKNVIEGINENKDRIDDIVTEIGEKKVDAYYVLDDVSGTLEVVDDSTEPFDPLTQVKESDVIGIAGIGDKVNLVAEVPSTGIYEYVDSKVGDIDFSTLQTKEDTTLDTTSKTVVGGINENKTAIDDIKVDIGEKADIDAGTLATGLYKEIEDGIKVVDDKVKALNSEIGDKKVVGVPQHYEKCLQTDDGALEVVDTVTDSSTQIALADVDGIAVTGEYVKLVAEVQEIPATGMYKYVEDSINQALVGGEIDLSGYQEKLDNDLNTDDKSLVNAINALLDDDHVHEAYTDDEIQAMFDGTTEELQYYESLIQDQTVSTNRLFSSQETVNRITQALLESQKYANDLVGGLSMVKAKKVETKPDTGEELTIYLVGTEGNYHQYMFIEGAWADLGSTNITLDGYVSEEKLTEELAKKADDDKVLKLDKVTTAMSTTPSNDNVLSELAVKNLLDGKADSDNIPTKTSELTNDSGFLTNDTLPEYPTTRTDDEIKNLADGQISDKITTTIDSTSTDEQLASALATYKALDDKNIYNFSSPTEGDANTLVIKGKSVHYQISNAVMASGTIANLPPDIGVGGLLISHGLATIHQFFLTHNNRVYKRYGYWEPNTTDTEATWVGTWQRIISENDFNETVNGNGGIRIEIPENADMNNYTTAGFYKVLGGAIARTIANLPIQNACLINIYGNSSFATGWITQEIIADNAITNNRYIRYKIQNNTDWSPWEKIVTTRVQDGQALIWSGSTDSEATFDEPLSNYPSAKRLILVAHYSPYNETVFFELPKCLWTRNANLSISSKIADKEVNIYLIPYTDLTNTTIKIGISNSDFKLTQIYLEE